MLKAIIAFILGDICLSLVSMKVPLFRRNNSKKWENETYLQRFCNCFFLPLFVFILCITISYYRDVNLPSDSEKMLESGEVEYMLETDADEIGGADIVYKIGKENNSEQIKEIIVKICKDLNKENDVVYVSPGGENYVIMENGKTVGNVIISEKKYGLNLEFYWED